MSNTSLYKYINLLFKIIIGIGALWFIYFKLKDEFIIHINQIDFHNVNYVLLIIVFLLMFANWGVEAYKWRFSISKTKRINFVQAFGITLTAITASLITPNRIGEVPVRALLLDREKFKELTSRTIVSSFSQLIMTILIGSIAFGLGGYLFDFTISPVIIYVLSMGASLLTLILYFYPSQIIRLIHLIPYLKRNKIGQGLSDFTFIERLKLLLLSIGRYMVFSLQYYLVLLAFGIELKGMYEVLLIPVCFLFASIIPTLLLSEIGVRSAVAILVFGVVSDQVLLITFASIALWAINVAVPAIIGLVNINQLKIIKQR